MTVDEFLSFTNHAVTLRLIDSEGEILGVHSTDVIVGKTIPEKYRFRTLNSAKILWDERIIVLFTDSEITYREKHEFTTSDGKLEDVTEDGNFQVRVTKPDGSVLTVPYSMTMDSDIPDRYCNHFVMDDKDYYFG